MKPNRKAELLKELEHLKELIEFHVAYKEIIWKNKPKEYESHINAMLDFYNKLQLELKSLDKKENNDNNK